MMVKIIPHLYGGMGIFFILYFVVISVYCGYFPDVSWIWVVAGGILLLFGRIAGMLAEKGRIVLGFLFLAGILFFVVCFFILAKQGTKKPKGEAEYVIVLGAKVNGRMPSRALRGRIEKAGEYLKEHKEAKGILTGGKGHGEEVEEAEAIREGLCSMGIEEERLYLEDKSTTTLENIAFAKQFISDQDAGIVIVTSDFHTLRGKSMAEDAGFSKVETLGAKTDPVMKLHYYTREVLAWGKYLLQRVCGTSMR